MEAAASLNDVSLRFGRRWVLVRLNLDIPMGATTLVTGENGSGKTTLLRILATALKPTRGRLELLGQPAYPDPDTLRPRIGLVTHQTHLYEDLSALENLRLVARLSATSDREEILMAHLERVGLAAHSQRNVRQFSAGMKRRLCVARLLARAPELAFLDEPFGRLDPAGIALIENVILELRERGSTVVLSTHDLARGRRLGDFHLELANGRQAGPVREIAA